MEASAHVVAPQGLRLWAIVSELDEIGALIIEAGGEVTPELEARLDAMEGQLEEKVERIALFASECKVNAAAAKTERDRLGAIVNAFESKEKALKGYLLRQLQRAQRTNVDTPRVRVREQRNSTPSVTFVGDVAKLPKAFKKITVSPDYALAAEEFKAGNKLPKGFVATINTHLRIS